MHVEMRTWKNKVNDQHYVRVRTFNSRPLQQTISSILEVKSFDITYLTEFLESEMQQLSMKETFLVIGIVVFVGVIYSAILIGWLNPTPERVYPNSAVIKVPR